MADFVMHAIVCAYLSDPCLTNVPGGIRAAQDISF